MRFSVFIRDEEKLCSECAFHTNDKEVMRIHEETMHAEEAIPCHECGKSFMGKTLRHPPRLAP